MRCNVGINPKDLTDQHLIAEYRELFIPFGMNKKYGEPKTVPNKFTLNKGHINFFRNKLLYLENRWDYIVTEMEMRGFNPKYNTFIYDLNAFDKSLVNTWMPDDNDTKLIKERIIERVKQKPNFYRKNKVKINPEDYCKKLLKSVTFLV